jgi:transcriptional regulator with XRE-family HTH domain
MVSAAVLRLRRERGWSAATLADRCAELGYPVPRSVIANMEIGRRDDVSAAELLILARALDVAPVDLLVDAQPDVLVELLPGRLDAVRDARAWLVGEAKFGVRTCPCAVCHGVPPRGFVCGSCGRESAEVDG